MGHCSGGRSMLRPYSEHQPILTQPPTTRTNLSSSDISTRHRLIGFGRRILGGERYEDGGFVIIIVDG